MIAAAHKTVGAVGATLLRHIGVVNGMASKLEISMDCSKLGEREAARAIKKAGKKLLSGIQGRHRKKWRREMGKRTRGMRTGTGSKGSTSGTLTRRSCVTMGKAYLRGW
jgi:hypothetical protein